MYAIRSYYELLPCVRIVIPGDKLFVAFIEITAFTPDIAAVITSYSIHYTKLYEDIHGDTFAINQTVSGLLPDILVYSILKSASLIRSVMACTDR